MENLGYGCCRTITNTMQNYETMLNHYETILNYFVNRETNAFAESFDAKIKAFGIQPRGVGNIPLFMFGLCRLTV
ncbi:transposase [Bacteroides caecimuris]|uniref:transposase n=2 Tax=Bacteroides caecimuris TaxID=1796613 RepID=UPI00345BEA7C